MCVDIIQLYKIKLRKYKGNVTKELAKILFVEAIQENAVMKHINEIGIARINCEQKGR